MRHPGWEPLNNDVEVEGKIMRQLIRKRNERGNGGEHRSEKQCFLKQIKVVYYLKVGLIILLVEFISTLEVYKNHL